MVKGRPLRYIRGHAGGERRDRHILSGIDIPNRRAICIRCGEVTVKWDSERNNWRCTAGINKQHRLTSKDEALRKGWCTYCSQEVDIVRHANRWACLNAVRRHQRLDRERNAETKRASAEKMRAAGYWRNNHFIKTYGITLEEYEGMLRRQGNACAICRVPFAESGRAAGHVDHCHTTGITREILCNGCNSALGMLHEDPVIIQAALDYIVRWKAATNTERAGLSG